MDTAVSASLAALGAATFGLTGRNWTEAAGPAVSVALVQGSISQDRKWLPEQREPTMALYRDLTFALPEADIVVWPEVAVPSQIDRVGPYLDELQSAAAERESARGGCSKECPAAKVRRGGRDRSWASQRVICVGRKHRIKR